MSNQDRYVRTFEVLFLGALFMWTLSTGVALLHPATSATVPNGVVEIYSLTAEPSGPSA